MNYELKKTGLTLIEILIVVGIIAILTLMVIGLTRRIDDQGKERLTVSTLKIVDAALGQFRDYGYNYDKDSKYTAFKFPLDCNGFDTPDLQNTVQDALGLGPGDVAISGVHDTDYSGSEAMYLFLSKVPDSRETLRRINSSLMTNLDSSGNPIEIEIDTTRTYPLLRVIDAWGTTLRYDYYDEEPPPIGDPQDMIDSRRNFPLVTSAGPDKKFGTVDDLSNR